MVDDVTLHHYGTCDIYQEFSDAVYVTVPVTIICSTQMTALTPCPGITKAGGLSNMLQVQKGQWRRMGTVTLSPRLMPDALIGIY